jgi:hypothetical protein
MRVHGAACIRAAPIPIRSPARYGTPEVWGPEALLSEPVVHDAVLLTLKVPGLGAKRRAGLACLAFVSGSALG